MSIRVSLCDMLRLIWVDILRRDHNVGFLAGQLIFKDPHNHLHYDESVSNFSKCGKEDNRHKSAVNHIIFT